MPADDDSLFNDVPAPSRARPTLRVAVGFATCGVVAALLVAPNADELAYRVALAMAPAADEVTTASIRPAARPVAAPAVAAPRAPVTVRSTGAKRRYTVRRSVLAGPDEVCIVSSDPAVAGCR